MELEVDRAVQEAQSLLLRAGKLKADADNLYLQANAKYQEAADLELRAYRLREDAGIG